MTVTELALKGFISELLKQADWIELSASARSFQIVYVDDIKELAEKYGMEME